MISQKKIADVLGFSIATVSMALRNHPSIPEITRKKVHKKAQELGYQPNPLFSTLMSNLHKHQYHETIAFLTSWSTPEFWRRYHSQVEHFEAAAERASTCGFRLEHIWMGSTDWDISRLQDVLQNRKVRSIILPYLSDDLKKQFRWDQFVVTTIGWNMEDPRMNAAMVDYDDAVQQALFGLQALGHRKIGLALNHEADYRSSFRFSGRYLAYQQRLEENERCAPFLPNTDEAWNQRGFAKWLTEQKPTAVICQADEVPGWVRTAGFLIPREISLVHLDWGNLMTDWAGINQNSRAVGASAIDLIAGQLLHNEFGVPTHAHSLLVKSTWVPGPSSGHAPIKRKIKSVSARTVSVK